MYAAEPQPIAHSLHFWSNTQGLKWLSNPSHNVEVQTFMHVSAISYIVGENDNDHNFGAWAIGDFHGIWMRQLEMSISSIPPALQRKNWAFLECLELEPRAPLVGPLRGPSNFLVPAMRCDGMGIPWNTYGLPIKHCLWDNSSFLHLF